MDDRWDSVSERERRHKDRPVFEMSVDEWLAQRRAKELNIRFFAFSYTDEENWPWQRNNDDD